MATINEIKDKLNDITDPSDPFLLSLKQDSRKGVQQLLKSWNQRYQKTLDLKQRFQKMMEIERDLYNQGYQYIAGVDEVGRGPLAGPVVTAAVILPKDFDEFEVYDSKQLSIEKRNYLYQKIQEKAIDISINVCSNETIDQINIYEATKKSMIESINNLKNCDYLLLDAMNLDIKIPQKKIIKGDQLSISIAAASIIAKVTRDNLMIDYDKQYPGYDFKNNMGYGTKKHIQGIKKIGITPIHRKTFAPVKYYL